MRPSHGLPALALLLFFPARADDAPAAKAPSQAKLAASGGASLTVARDPVTGALRPLTPEESRHLLGARPLAVAAPQVVTLPDGTRMMRLGPRHKALSVARKNPDGTLASACVHGTAEAEAFTQAAPRPASASAPASREK